MSTDDLPKNKKRMKMPNIEMKREESGRTKKVIIKVIKILSSTVITIAAILTIHYHLVVIPRNDSILDDHKKGTTGFFYSPSTKEIDSYIVGSRPVVLNDPHDKIKFINGISQHQLKQINVGVAVIFSLDGEELPALYFSSWMLGTSDGYSLMPTPARIDTVGKTILTRATVKWGDDKPELVWLAPMSVYGQDEEIMKLFTILYNLPRETDNLSSAAKLSHVRTLYSFSHYSSVLIDIAWLVPAEEGKQWEEVHTQSEISLHGAKDAIDEMRTVLQ